PGTDSAKAFSASEARQGRRHCPTNTSDRGETAPMNRSRCPTTTAAILLSTIAALTWADDPNPPFRTLERHTGSAMAVDFSPDGKTLASGGKDKPLRLWNVRTGEPLRTLVGHTDMVKSVVYSPNGRLLASGSSDRTVRLWDAQSGASIAVLEGHTGSLE